jgi:hypothetical protein
MLSCISMGGFIHSAVISLRPATGSHCLAYALRETFKSRNEKGTQEEALRKQLMNS